MHSYRWCGSMPSTATATTTTATTMIRRLCCLQSVSPSLPFSSASTTTKKPLVFLGAPQVSAIVLDTLLNASASPHSLFEVAAIVTQPPARRDRGKKLALSPLATHALDRGFSPDLIFTPDKAGDDVFLSNLKALQPHLCITAAYGNILPTKFLDIPPLGTVNIHPSMLPLYRGAAPVQRALQDGVKETGVSLAFTVRALDAGPIIATETIQVDDQIKAPDLLELLFHKGSELLIRELPSILDGSAILKAQPQDDSKATLAPKINSDESWLSFDEEAYVLHNKVLEVQLPGKKAVNAAAFWNGLPVHCVYLTIQNLSVWMLYIMIKVRMDCDGCERRVRNANVIYNFKNLLFVGCRGEICGAITSLWLLYKNLVRGVDMSNFLPYIKYCESLSRKA
ncbi:uncharacterized protein HKW66_Vig0256750 [Vigna angularis]|uniref:methionyl-tRNA formyltransferase n=1 Tax=Phaseolus angularis TaxID=3914 RepID=A0A8T0JX59_PHAAN|nr:uncharacterized protein HKW66_Vig0256750 [Vigna angularis]